MILGHDPKEIGMVWFPKSSKIDARLTNGSMHEETQKKGKRREMK
jgi:hypothetical protein